MQNGNVSEIIKDSEMRVEMLGGFTIIAEGLPVADPGKKSSKIWRLIQYLVANKNRPVTQEELLEIFCGEDSKGNPGSVLRTMVYRARTMLTEQGLKCANEIIVAKSGCYSWNHNMLCTTDTEELESLSKTASLCSDEDEKLSILLQIANLYKGDFLQGQTGDMWTIPLVRWYRSIYMDAVKEALDILMEKDRLPEAEELAVKALSIDRFDESLLIYYLRILLSQKKNDVAIKVYKKMEAMFYDEMGVDFSEDLHALYDEMQTVEEPADAPLDDIVSSWISDCDPGQVYYCDPSDFKVLCQIEARSAYRSGNITYIIRFNAKYEPDKKGRGDGVMKNLEKAISECLRTSDIFTRYGPHQYLIMLRSLTYEDCKMLINKILGKLDAKYLSCITDTSIMHISPTGEYLKVNNGNNTDIGAESSVS